MNARAVLFPLASCLCLFVFTGLSFAQDPDCTPDGTEGNDEIGCAGTDLDGTTSGEGDDNITVGAGAYVGTLAIDPQPQTAAVDGGAGKDTVASGGVVAAIATTVRGATEIPAAEGETEKQYQGAAATGILGGAGDDTIDNSGSASATGVAVAPAFGVGLFGGKLYLGEPRAQAEATGIDGSDGDDSLTNGGDATATSTATAIVGVGTLNLGISSKDTATTATATAVAVEGGAGQDTLSNTGNSTAVSTSVVGVESAALSGGINVIAPNIGANTSHTAEANATGLSGGDEPDSITNTGNSTAVATATSGSLSVDIRTWGGSKALSTSEAKANAKGIDGGDGDDTIGNSGAVTAIATSVATGQSAAVSKKGKESKARGSWGGGATSDAKATGINASAGQDTIGNTAAVTAVATAVSGSSAAGITADGVGAADSTSKAEAVATGIDAGKDGDTVTNDGAVTAVSTATAGALDIAFSYKGSTKTQNKSGASAEATAVGISGDGTDKDESSDSSFHLDPIQVIRTSRQEETAPVGADTITNNAAVTTVATAVTTSGSISIAIKKAAAADTKSSAKATATAIDAGAGNDIVSNNGALTAVSTATAATIDAGFSEGDKGEAKAGATAEAEAFGIRGDGTEASSIEESTIEVGWLRLDTNSSTEKTAATGNDTITNAGAITAIATAVSGTESAGVSVRKTSKGDASSTAKALSVGVEAGAGNDTVTNFGAITAVSTATAGGAGFGFSESKKSEAKGGSIAESTAIGVRGDGDAASTSKSSSLHIGLDGHYASYRNEKVASTGNDTITNNAAITAVATSVSGSGSASFSIKDAASADVSSTAKSLAIGIDAGAGNDKVTNNAAITAVSTATAGSAGIGVVEGGRSDAKAAATAEADAFGIRADGTEASSLDEATHDLGFFELDASLRFERSGATGTDTINNTGAVTAVASAVSGAATVGISAKNAGKADATTTARSLAVGIEAGGGDDSVDNSGAVTAVSTAAAGSIGFGFSESAKGEAKVGSTAESEAVGIRGDGTDTSHVTEAALSFGPRSLDSDIGYTRTASTGTDTINNSGAITAISTAASGAAGIAASVKKAGETNSTSRATSRAAAIDAGAGDDTVDNSGALTSVSTSAALAAGLTVTQDKNARANADTVSESTAVGISGDGVAGSREFDANLSIDIGTLDAGIRYAQKSASGDDTITNSSAVTAVSNAVSGTGTIGVSISGSAAADATSAATSSAFGIDGGGGDDTITNTEDGVVTAVSTATAGEYTVAIAGKGGAADLKSVWNGGTRANATAVGVSGDSTGKDFSTDSTVEINVLELRVAAKHETSFTQAGGADDLTNDGVVTATAVATAPSVDVSVALDGMSGALTTSEATARASGIDAGTGDDKLTNTGTVVATSVATAAAVNVAVSKKAAISADALWEGSTSAESEAVGLSGDGEGRNWVASGSLIADLDGVRLGADLSTTTVSGDDEITNEGTVVASSAALAPVVGVAASVESYGAAVTTSEATSRAAGIDAGSGADTVTNTDTGVLVSSSLASAATVNVAVSKSTAVAGNMLWDGDTQANSESVGISGDGQGRDWSANGTVEVTPNEVRLDAGLSTTVAGGIDDITNDGTIVASSAAVVPSFGIAVSVEGAAAAMSASEANSRAAGIDAGTDGDIVMNRGEIIASSLSTAGDLNAVVSKSFAMADNSVFDGGSTATSDAIGIGGDGEGRDWQATGSVNINDHAVRLETELSTTVSGGNDTLDNEGTIVASSAALAPSVAVAVAIDGVAAATSTSLADSRAIGIDAGTGDDTVTNTGSIVSTSLATAAAANVAVGKGAALATGALFEGGTRATSEAVGISGDGEGRDWTAQGSIEVTDEATRLDGSLASTVVSGKDDITNDGTIVATSAALTPALDVAVALQGVAASVSKASAEAEATGIDAGSGNDKVVNNGTIVATAASNADAISVAVAPTGVSLVGSGFFEGGASATSDATGISGDGEGRDWRADGTIEVTEEATRLDASTSSTVVSGEDEITNEGSIVATSVAIAPSIGVSVAMQGVAGSITTSTADAKAAGIDAGGGNDTIINRGAIVSTSVANADSVSVAFTPAGVALATDAIWDGGTKATAESVGISGDGEGRDWQAGGRIEVTEDAVHLGTTLSTTEVSGNDDITNEGTVVSTAVAASISANVAVALEGVAGAAATATAESKSTAIDAGAGGDRVDNSGALVSSAAANANAIAVSVTPAGAAFAVPASFDGGTTATAEAVGISGDGEGRDWQAEGTIEIDEESTRLGTTLSSTVVSGNDTIDNDGTIVTSSLALTPNLGVAVAVAGVAGSVSTSTANSSAASIDAGGGNDTVDNTAALVTTSAAYADTISVGVTPAGVAVTTDAIWDGGTEAHSTAVGISGDGEGRDWLVEGSIESTESSVRLEGIASSTVISGTDEITNSGEVITSSLALARSTNATVAIYGVGGAASTAGSISSATAIDAGAGSDFIDNSGTLVSTSLALSDAEAATVVLGGVAVAGGSIFDGGTSASSEAIGIGGDGEGRDWMAASLMETTPEHVYLGTDLVSAIAGGNDTIINTGDIVATSSAGALAVDIPVAIFGVAGAITAANADSSAIAIDAGAGADTVDNSGTLVSTSVATALTAPLAIGPIGTAIAANDFWDGGTEARAEAIGINADGDGSDWLASGFIEATEDTLIRSDTLSITRAGGNDNITNEGTIVATAVAEVPSITASVGLIGAAGSISTSEAEARAVAIDAGVGGDEIFNYEDLVATSVANANTLNVAVNGGGIGLAADSVWDGGTKATSEAIGISGDGKGRNMTADEIIDSTGDAIVIGGILTSDAVSGNDSIYNEAEITATSVAISPSAAITFSAAGVSAALSNAVADATALAIDAGAGDDSITNHGELTATSVANADAIAVAAQGGGVAVAGNAFWDSGTEATAIAVGISGDGVDVDESVIGIVEAGDGEVRVATELTRDAGGGVDIIDNFGDVTATAVAVSPAISASLVGAGVGTNISTATADATALAIDGGAGGDSIDNEGNLVATAVANADAIRMATTLVGVGIGADSVWDGGTSATAEAIGIASDGVGRDETIEAAVEVANRDIHIGSGYSSTAALGNDTIDNSGDIKATSVVVAPSITQSTTMIGASAAISTATAEAQSVAIDAGAGDDEVTNSGYLDAAAVSNADAISVSFAGLGLSIASDAVWDGGATAIAEAIGISADRAEQDSTLEATIDVVDGNVRVGVLTTESEVVGNDTVTNYGDIDATAVAVAPSIGIANAVVGGAAAVTTATAESRAVAIDAGGGGDTVTNTAALHARSFANADAVSLTNLVVGVSGAGTSAWEGGPKAEAEAIGISGDGQGNIMTDRYIEYSGNNLDIVQETTTENVGGDDFIDNSGAIVADADAVSVSAAVSIVGVGMAAAVSTSEANARAAAIDAGGGDDTVINEASLTAEAGATAVGVAVDVAAAGLAVAADAVWDGGTTAEAEAIGISGDSNSENTVSVQGIVITDSGAALVDETTSEVAGGTDTIENYDTISAVADSSSTSVGVSAAALGVSTSVMTGTARSNAAGIDAGGGIDTIDNNGQVTSQASATANTVAFGGAVAGATLASDAFWDNGTTADANATGIDAGADNDELDNQALVASVANARTTSTGVAVGLIGASGAITTATADAEARALDGGEGNDVITNNSLLYSEAVANAIGTSVAVEIGGYAATDSSTAATATAIGIDGGDGDDDVTNLNSIWSETTVTGTTTEGTVTVAGVANDLELLNSGSTADGHAFGITGGGGNDELENAGAIALVSNASAGSTDVSINIAGYSNVDASSTVSSGGTGMTGDDGTDIVINRGLIDITSQGNAQATAVTIQLAGAEQGDARTSAVAVGIGASGGAGDDEVINAGTIQMTSRSAAPATNVSVQLAGAGSTVAGAVAESNAVGLAGDNGDDVLVNIGTIDIARIDNDPDVPINEGDTEREYVSAAVATVDGVTVNLAGAARQLTAATAVARVTGIAGGSGDDFVGNTGSIYVRSAADADVDDFNFMLAGASTAAGTASAVADAVGFSGGSGADLLYNENLLDVDAESTLSSTGEVDVVFGFADSDASIRGTLYATGIGGDEDDDEIINIGTVNVGGNINASVNGSTWTLGGVADASAGMTSWTFIDGFNGGEGADLIFNEGSLFVSANSIATLDTSSWTFGGNVTDSGSFMAFDNAIGILGGIGNDEIINDGVIDVHAVTHLNALGGSTAIFGDAGAGAVVTAGSLAGGIDGNDDDDLILNLGSLNVLAQTDVTSNTTALAGIGQSTAQAGLLANAAAWGIHGGFGTDNIVNDTGNMILVNAVSALTTPAQATAPIGQASTLLNAYSGSAADGIEGGPGPDTILNDGFLSASAISSVTATGGASVVWGGASAELAAAANAVARGVGSGRDDDILINRGTVIADALAYPSTSNDVGTNGFLIFRAGVNTASSSAAGSSNATAVDLGLGSNTLVNQGSLHAIAGGVAGANSIAASSILPLSAPAHAQSLATFNTLSATGVTGGDGNNLVLNESDLNVTAGGVSFVLDDGALVVWPGTDALASARADGDGAWSGWGTAIATARADNAVARGIYLSGGDNVVRNSDSITVIANPIADAHAVADADGISFSIPNATATTLTSANNALAVGIELGHGDNEVLNENMLTVIASPLATEAEGDASAGPGEVGIDAFVTTVAQANDSRAYGIRTGGGANTIWNTGTIVAQASPHASANSNAHGVGVAFIHGDARSWAFANNALAVGIQTGSGNDVIYNEGLIDVVSDASADVWADGRVTTLGIESCIINTCYSYGNATAANGRAIGISTGSGDDIVWNAGTITAAVRSATTEIVDSATTSSTSNVSGVGVDLGAGNDALVLLHNSQISGNVVGGSGDDLLAVEGAATIFGLATGFETLDLFGTSNLDVLQLDTVEQLLVGEGTLNINAPYSMSANGIFRAQVNGDGTHGVLDVTGLPLTTVMQLDGNLVVTMGAGIFLDNTSYDIITTTSTLPLWPANLGGAFASTTLPEPTPLLSFTTEQLNDRYTVTANVESMTSVASNSIADQSFAALLDNFLPVAEGDLESLLARMQRIPDGSVVSEVIADLNPANYATLTESALATVDTYMDGVNHRLNSLRSKDEMLPFHGRGLMNFYGEEDRFGTGAIRDFETWSALVTQVADLGGLSGNRGLLGETAELIGGVDFSVGEDSTFGLAFGSTLTVGTIDGTGATAASSIDGRLFSLYGTHNLGTDTYLNAQMAFGDHSFMGVRAPSNELPVARGFQHESSAAAGRIEFGRIFRQAYLKPEAYASVGYRRLHEGAIDEVGGFGLGVTIDRRSTRSLETELGIRIERSLDSAIGIIRPRMDFAWVYDFYAGENFVNAKFRDMPDYGLEIPIGVQSRNALRLGGGISLLNGSNYTLTAGFESDIRKGPDRLSAKVGFRQDF